MSLEHEMREKLDAIFTLTWEGGVPMPDPETGTPEEWSTYGGLQLLTRELGACVVLLAREIDKLQDDFR